MTQDSQTQVPQKMSKEQLTKFQAEFEKLPPEKKAELIEQQCLFCQISRGQIEAVKVYEDNDVIALLDIAPASPGHALVIPRRHFQFVFQLPPDLRNKLFEIASRVSVALVNVTKATGLSMYIASGASAGQRVPHLAVNLIPRFEKDGLAFEWEGKKVTHESLEKFAEKLRGKIEQPSKAETEAEKKSASAWLKQLVERMERIP